jgi:phospholipid/cholesterol/gamma-HCH transport system substrate-binding protein
MHRHVLETITGILVLAVAAAFLWFGYRTADIGTAPGYEVGAVFTKVGGLAVGNDVRINGIKVGTVTSRILDPKTFEAVVRMTVDRAIRLPEDTRAVVASEGPLGGKYIELEPGRSQTLLAENGMIRDTRSYRSLEDQVGEIIFLATSKPGERGPP